MATQTLIQATTIASSISIGAHILRIIARTVFQRQIETDLDVFFDEAVFAEPVVVSHADGTVDTVSGIFDEEGSTVDLQGDLGVMSTEPQFQCRARELSRMPAPETEVRIRGRIFRVREVTPDGTGAVTVKLLRS